MGTKNLTVNFLSYFCPDNSKSLQSVMSLETTGEWEVRGKRLCDPRTPPSGIVLFQASLYPTLLSYHGNLIQILLGLASLGDPLLCLLLGHIPRVQGGLGYSLGLRPLSGCLSIVVMLFWRGRGTGTRERVHLAGGGRRSW